jgi:hypothetical protein
VYTEDMQLAAAEAKRKAASEGLTLETSCRQGRCGYSGVRLRVVPDPSGSGPLGQSFRCALRKPSQSEVAGFNAFARPSLLVELPDGWVCLSTRRYAGPNGERARSKRQAWQISRGEVGRVSLGRGRTRGPYEAEYAHVYLGRFHTAEEAALAYARAKARERGAPGLGASLAPEVAEDEDEQDDLEDDEDDEEVAAAFFAAQAELAA